MSVKNILESILKLVCKPRTIPGCWRTNLKVLNGNTGCLLRGGLLKQNCEKNFLRDSKETILEQYQGRCEMINIADYFEMLRDKLKS
jgi:hypothetical protein